MALELLPIDRISRNDRSLFQETYFKNHQPAVITDFCHDWPAYTNWSFQNLKKRAGHLTVDLYNNKPADPDKSSMFVDERMNFGEYLDLIASNRHVELRIFLFNIFKHIPELKNDILKPDLIDGFMMNLPFMFYGGAGSVVHMHYDIDLSHVFLTQFVGRKRVVLFAPEYTPLLYRLPYSVVTYTNVNHPDYEKYPGLQYVKGYECTLDYGETIYIPSGYWHYMEYIDGGYALALRVLNESWMKRLEGAWNLLGEMKIDNFMKKYFTRQWFEYKNRKAFENADAAMRGLRRPEKLQV
ncbi:cupin-like domain-containing protein [Larkinella soli]|uniref:cupin-like domain-containing protein n=1 Tax=Larkinella soli TaxID=1770527 RepID=UPI000FFC547A|nr:cupin-like domain-containing protein [Larkinella soli]